MTAAREKWLRVTRSRPCPVCGRPDWCVVAPDGGAAICARTESARRCGDAGWLHRLRDERRPFALPRPIRAARPAPATTVTPDLAGMARRYQAAVNPFDLIRFAADLGVDRGAMMRLGLGWDGEAWTFPMQHADGCIIGIRRRFPDGRKLAVTGGHEGLFIPHELAGGDMLLVCEGPTDTAALLGLGLTTIGRPSCSGGVKLVAELVRGRAVAIVADADEPGRRGAEALARLLVVCCPSVRIITPPAGSKDAREWVRSGATRADVLAAIEAARPWPRFSAAAVAALKGGAT